jgi:hypothetical protein
MLSAVSLASVWGGEREWLWSKSVVEEEEEREEMEGRWAEARGGRGKAFYMMLFGLISTTTSFDCNAIWANQSWLRRVVFQAGQGKTTRTCNSLQGELFPPLGQPKPKL